MCRLCKRCVRYIDIYNNVFSSLDRERAIKKMLSHSSKSCYMRRLKVAEHLYTIMTTQSIGGNLPHVIWNSIHEEQRITSSMSNIRTRRLVDAMLRHSYRPFGPIMTRLAGPFAENTQNSIEG